MKLLDGCPVPVRRLTLAPVLVLALVGCTSVSPTPSGSLAPSTAPSGTPPVARTSTPAASQAAPASPWPAPSPTLRPPAAEPPPLGLELVTGGLVDPIGITSTPDGWLLVNERAGRVIAVNPADGSAQVALDIRDRVLGQGEQGLLGLVADPDAPRAFVHYSDRNGDTVLAEFTAADGFGVPRFDPASERRLLTVDQPFNNHNGGQLALGPDGMLWMGLGDGGSGGDPSGNGQNPGVLLGSILRLEVATAGAYAIPPDNPFATGGGAPEVYLYGVRNPWRFSFDRATGELWIGDVGQNAFEEVDRLDPAADAGANLGWNAMEGWHCYAVADCSSDGLVLPITEFGRDAGCSITGGYVYRGAAIPDLWGWYLFSDYCSGLVFGVPSDAQPDGGPVPPDLLLETGARVTAFGEDRDGELYLVDLGSGTLYRIVAGG